MTTAKRHFSRVACTTPDWEPFPTLGDEEGIQIQVTPLWIYYGKGVNDSEWRNLRPELDPLCSNLRDIPYWTLRNPDIGFRQDWNYTPAYWDEENSIMWGYDSINGENPDFEKMVQVKAYWSTQVKVRIKERFVTLTWDRELNRFEGSFTFPFSNVAIEISYNPWTFGLRIDDQAMSPGLRCSNIEKIRYVNHNLWFSLPLNLRFQREDILETLGAPKYWELDIPVDFVGTSGNTDGVTWFSAQTITLEYAQWLSEIAHCDPENEDFVAKMTKEGDWVDPIPYDSTVFEANPSWWYSNVTDYICDDGVWFGRARMRYIESYRTVVTGTEVYGSFGYNAVGYQYSSPQITEHYVGIYTQDPLGWSPYPLITNERLFLRTEFVDHEATLTPIGY